MKKSIHESIRVTQNSAKYSQNTLVRTDGLDFGLAGFPAAARSPSDERACRRPREMRAGARRRAVLESCQSDRWFGNASLFIFGQPGLRLQLDSLDFGYFQRKIVKKCGFEFGRAIRIL